jgi:molybdopterin-containing oxidoreductase family membrane subunit
MNIIIMLTGSMVGVAYLTELFVAWYSGVEYEGYAFMNRATGPYWWAYAAMMTCNVISPQLMWFKKIRRNLVITFILSIIVNIGMWFERFVIIVTSIHRDYITSSWTQFHPTYVDMGVFLGTIGLFFVLFLLYSRVFPVLALNEVKTILRATGEFGVKKAKSTVFNLENEFSPSESGNAPASDDSSEESSDDAESEENKEQE